MGLLDLIAAAREADDKRMALRREAETVRSAAEDAEREAIQAWDAVAAAVVELGGEGSALWFSVLGAVANRCTSPHTVGAAET